MLPELAGRLLKLGLSPLWKAPGKGSGYEPFRYSAREGGDVYVAPFFLPGLPRVNNNGQAGRHLFPPSCVFFFLAIFVERRLSP
jgi:hypothetical protein